ncbi:MAG: carboxypeptidase regulatory-like domain-containing protein [Planctomycetes bacterium]|nr:carboxypeptidase regulatory-like domain-containing protein [Planctomycetota bacterium]
MVRSRAWLGLLLPIAVALPAQWTMEPVTGTVVDPRGVPIAGAEVELRTLAGIDLRGLDQGLAPPWRRSARARTDRDGHFGMQGPVGVPCLLVVDHAPFAVFLREGRLVGADLRLELESACTLFGQVRAAADGAGQPAEVLVLDEGSPVRSVRTDAEGHYRCERLASEGYTVRFLPDGAAVPKDVDVELTAAAPVECSPTLRAGRTVTGSVCDANTGAPIPGAALLLGWQSPVRARSDAAGRFVVAGFPEGAGELHCLTPDHQRGIWHAPQAGAGEATFRLGAGTTARGRLVDERGAPLAGAAVAAFGVESNTQIYFHFAAVGRSDADGRFELTGLGYDEQIPTLLAGGEGRALVGREGGHKGIELDYGTVVVPGPRLLRGCVVDADGEPVVGVEVGLWGGNDDRFAEDRLREESRCRHDGVEMVAGWRFHRTAADGRFAFGDLPRGTYEVEVRGVQGARLGLVTGVQVKDRVTELRVELQRDPPLLRGGARHMPWR